MMALPRYGHAFARSRWFDDGRGLSIATSLLPKVAVFATSSLQCGGYSSPIFRPYDVSRTRIVRTDTSLFSAPVSVCRDISPAPRQSGNFTNYLFFAAF